MLVFVPKWNLMVGENGVMRTRAAFSLAVRAGNTGQSGFFYWIFLLWMAK